MKSFSRKSQNYLEKLQLQKINQLEKIAKKLNKMIDYGGKMNIETF